MPRELADGATRRIAEYAAGLDFGALPEAVVTLTKRSILDTLGVALAATGLAPEAPKIAQYVVDAGGRPDATLFGSAYRAPAQRAAFVNGSLCHMLDYGDTVIGAHVGSMTVPTAFAVAEKLGGISGQALLTAVAVGQDLSVRFSLAQPRPFFTADAGWFSTQFYGYLTAAAVAGRLMGFEPARMEQALGIAYQQLNGSRQMAVGEAADVRGLQAGFSNQGGILAAELAELGITGSTQIFEGTWGLYASYLRCEPHWTALVGDLGTRFSIGDHLSFKVWPACGGTRHTNAAILELRDTHGLTPDDVDELVILDGGERVTDLLTNPLVSKRRPRSTMDAKFSIPFTSAIMMVRGNVTMQDYTEQARADPEVLAMADRVTYRPPERGPDDACRPGIQIRTRDGRALTRWVDHVPGDPARPANQDILEAKFRDCAAFCARPIAASRIERAVKLIRDLEHVEDATTIIRMLRPEQ